MSLYAVIRRVRKGVIVKEGVDLQASSRFS